MVDDGWRTGFWTGGLACGPHHLLRLAHCRYPNHAFVLPLLPTTDSPFLPDVEDSWPGEKEKYQHLIFCPRLLIGENYYAIPTMPLLPTSRLYALQRHVVLFPHTRVLCLIWILDNCSLLVDSAYRTTTLPFPFTGYHRALLPTFPIPFQFPSPPSPYLPFGEPTCVDDWTLLVSSLRTVRSPPRFWFLLLPTTDTVYYDAVLYYRCLTGSHPPRSLLLPDFALLNTLRGLFHHHLPPHLPPARTTLPWLFQPGSTRPAAASPPHHHHRKPHFPVLVLPRSRLPPLPPLPAATVLRFCYVPLPTTAYLPAVQLPLPQFPMPLPPPSGTLAHFYTLRGSSHYRYCCILQTATCPSATSWTWLLQADRNFGLTLLLLVLAF